MARCLGQRPESDSEVLMVRRVVDRKVDSIDRSRHAGIHLNKVYVASMLSNEAYILTMKCAESWGSPIGFLHHNIILTRGLRAVQRCMLQDEESRA